MYRSKSPNTIPSSFFHQGMVGKGRWNSYYYQVQNVIQLQPNSVLEIGLGNHVVSDYLKIRVSRYLSMDIDFHVLPSVYASITNIPFHNNGFDVILAAEVLEHLPFEAFTPVLLELRRVTKKFVIISIPQTGVGASVRFTLPVIGTIGFGVKFSLHRTRPFDGLHYWEINRGGYPLRRIRKSIIDSGFTIINEFLPYNMLYNRFFILRI
jgi:hypothetical protein